MTESLPWMMYLFYISVGFLLVIAVTALTIAILARAPFNRFLYGIVFCLAAAGVGYQIASLIYYSTSSEIVALTALIWQVDFASAAYVAAALVVALEYYRGIPPKWVWMGGIVLTVALAVLNRSSPFSLHFGYIETLMLVPLVDFPSLSHFLGLVGWASWVGLASLCAVLLVALFGAFLIIRREDRWRGCVHGAMLLLLAAALVQSMLIDLEMHASLYLSGFAVTLFAAWISIGMAIDAASRSRRLLLRDRQMEGEIRQRRKAEDKLERLSQVFMQAPTATHIVDLSGKALQVNEESVRFLRRDVSVPPKVNFLAVLEQLGVDKSKLLAELKEGKVGEFGPYLFTAGIPVDSLYMVRDTWLAFKLYPIFNQKKQLQEFVVRLEDVTERQFIENAIKVISTSVSAETGQAFFTQLVLNLARLLNKKYVFIGLKKCINDVWCLSTQANSTDGQLVENIIIPLTNTPSQKTLERGTFAVERQITLEFPDQKVLRELGVQSYLGVAITNQDKQPIGVIAVMDVKPMEQITQVQEVVNIFVTRAGTELQRVEAEQKIRKMAYEDYLTGLPNRFQLNELVNSLLRDHKQGQVHAFIQMDLDHFKTINDALGHDVGDEVLTHISVRLRKHLGDTALLSRIGGDEFVLIIENIGPSPEAELARLAQQLINLTEQPVQVRDHLLDLGCTMGVVLFPEFASSVVDVFRNADIALNRAKTAGRGGYQMFTPQMRDAASKRLSVEKGLRKAIAGNELSLFYQPQVDSAGRLVGAEALARWKHPHEGWIPPLVFIPVAEETGLINVIGHWVLETALLHRKSWSEASLPFRGHLSINVSPWQFARPDFVSGVVESIERLKVPPSHITIEVTESALLTDLKETIEKLSQLRRLGTSIALDDFGTGYSSLAYLRDLPLDILKIDKAFVDALETNAQEPLVESMISIGRHMGLQVIAEGVETEIQLQRLVDMGCNVFQGYLFSKPLPEPQFVTWMSRNQSA